MKSILRGASRAAVVVFALVSSSSRSAGAFETKHTPSGAEVRWRAADVAWSLDPSVDQVSGGAQAFRDAALAWNASGAGAPTMKVTTSKTARSPGLDGVNGIFYVAGGFAPAGRALAITILNVDDATGEIVDADVVLNGMYALAAIEDAQAHGKADDAAVDEHDATPGATFDVRRIAAHELGHSLGLADAPDLSGALMYPYLAPDAPVDAKPAADDLAGIAAIYRGAGGSGAGAGAETGASAGAAGSSRGCGVAGASARRPRGATASALAGPYASTLADGIAPAALALALAVALRRRRGARGPLLAAGFVAFVAAAPFDDDSSATGSPQASSRSPSPLPARADARARVTRIRTESLFGLFRSEVELTPVDGAEPLRAAVWGGVMGGVRQVVGGRAAPREGEVVEIVTHDRNVVALRRIEG